MDKGLDQFYRGFNEGLDRGKDEFLNAVYALLRLDEKIAEAIREYEARQNED